MQQILKNGTLSLSSQAARSYQRRQNIFDDWPDSWIQSSVHSWQRYPQGGVQNQVECRRHDLSDGFAIIGVWSQPRVIPGYSTGSAQLRNDAGSAYVKIGWLVADRKAELAHRLPGLKQTVFLIWSGPSSSSEVDRLPFVADRLSHLK